MAASRNDRLDTAALARRWMRAEAERIALVRLARRTGLTEADAEDCVQESILKVVPRSDLDEDRMGSLLATVVKRRAIDLHRRAEAAARASRRLQTVASCEAEAPDVALCDRAEAEWSASVVERLPAFQRQVLLARAEGRTWSEIARELSTSVKAVESAVSRARASVRLAIAATLGVGIALARRWRQSTTALAGGTMAFVLIAVTAPLLHRPESLEPPAPRDSERAIELASPASERTSADGTAGNASTALQSNAAAPDHRGDRERRGGHDPHKTVIAEVPTPLYDVSYYEKDFNPGRDEDDLTQARKCAEGGYTLSALDLTVRSDRPGDTADYRPGYDEEDVKNAGDSKVPVQGHCNSDLHPR